MAEEADLRLLGEQLKRLQGDVRQLKTDMAQMHAENVRVESELAGLKAAIRRVEDHLDAFRESVDDRFDQTVDLLKSSFRSLSAEIQSLKQA